MSGFEAGWRLWWRFDSENSRKEPIVGGDDVEADENQEDEEKFGGAVGAGKSRGIAAAQCFEHLMALTRIHNVSQGSQRDNSYINPRLPQ